MTRRTWGLLALVLLCSLGADSGWRDVLPTWLRVFMSPLIGIGPRVLGRDFIVSNIGSGTACTDANPCTPKYALQTMNCTAGDIMTMLPGTYQGADYMVDLDAYAQNKSGTDASHVCWVRARTDGSVFIDGQFTRYTFFLNGNSWWTVEGIDFGNATNANGPTNSWAVCSLWNSNHVTLRRVICSNMRKVGTNFNAHTFTVSDSSDNLLEDIAIFGTGRNSFNEHGSNTGSARNTYRRLYTRWEGGVEDGGVAPAFQKFGCPGPNFQINYGTAKSSLYENAIAVYDPEQILPTGPGSRCYQQTELNNDGFYGTFYSSFLSRNLTQPSSAGNTLRGWIMYGYDNPNQLVGRNWFILGSTDGSGDSPTQAMNMKDIFLDARSQGSIPPMSTGGTAKVLIDRTTTIRGSTASTHAPSGDYGQFTNVNECTTLGACPNFYTGTTPGTGARNCFEYTDGVLGTTAATQGLWPWRMDNRIKAALARANAAGTGGSPLQGGAGSGYAAGTVTSEIAFRYGPIPAACSRTATAFAPDFPIVTDFPSTPVLDYFNRANGPIGANWTATTGTPFIIQGNLAKAPAGDFARMQWAASTFLGVHEVYATWPTMPPIGYDGTMLTFAGSAGLDVSQYRVYLARPAGANTTLRVLRINNLGASTTILGPIDLGTDIGDTAQSLGVRVNATQTINVYWKWTDAQWYRIGTVIDSTLPAATTAIGFAGSDTMTVDNFGGGTCCGAVNPSPGTMGRFGNLFPKQ